MKPLPKQFEAFVAYKIEAAVKVAGIEPGKEITALKREEARQAINLLVGGLFRYECSVSMDQGMFYFDLAPGLTPDGAHEYDEWCRKQGYKSYAS